MRAVRPRIAKMVEDVRAQDVAQRQPRLAPPRRRHGWWQAPAGTCPTATTVRPITVFADAKAPRDARGPGDEQLRARQKCAPAPAAGTPLSASPAIPSITGTGSIALSATATARCRGQARPRGTSPSTRPSVALSTRSPKPSAVAAMSQSRSSAAAVSPGTTAISAATPEDQRMDIGNVGAHHVADRNAGCPPDHAAESKRLEAPASTCRSPERPPPPNDRHWQPHAGGEGHAAPHECLAPRRAGARAPRGYHDRIHGPYLCSRGRCRSPSSRDVQTGPVAQNIGQPFLTERPASAGGFDV